MDWYLATQVMSDYVIARTIHDDYSKRKMKNDVTFRAVEKINQTATQAAITYAAPKILKHLAQNQIKGKIGIIGRVGGRAGLRFVPVLGTALLVKDAYSLYRYLTD